MKKLQKRKEINLHITRMNDVARSIRSKQQLYAAYSCDMKEEISKGYDILVLNYYQESMKWCQIEIKKMNVKWTLLFDELVRLRTDLKKLIDDIEVDE